MELAKVERYFSLYLSEHNSSDWVTRYDPEETANGYNLVLFVKRLPVLIDMNANIVHAWPRALSRGRARLMENGDLLTIGVDNKVKLYDWHGNLKWSYRVDDDDFFPHHDVIRLKNGNILFVVRDHWKSVDYLLEVNQNGERMWKWHFSDYLETYFSDRVSREQDVTHVNSVQELPENRWFDSGDTRFRPGNILVSARHLNTIFIIDKKTGDVVWQFSDELDSQHEALLIAPDYPGEGNILVFNNGTEDIYTYRKSSVVEINPMDCSIVWKYTSDYFFSRFGGVEQIMPNGNIVVTSSEGSRVFEINREGETLWQLVPCFKLMRVHRYPYEYCPQLRGRDRMVEQPVLDKNERPFVDNGLFEFGTDRDCYSKKIGGENRLLLKKENLCRQIIVPPEASIDVGYGLDTEMMKKSRLSEETAIFTVSLRPEGHCNMVVLLEDTVSYREDNPWHVRKVEIHEYAYQTVLLCIDTRIPETGNAPHDVDFALWENPKITSGTVRLLNVEDFMERRPKRLEEIEQLQMRELGYVE